MQSRRALCTALYILPTRMRGWACATRIYTDETSLRRAIQSAPEPGRPVDAARLAALLEQACE